MTVVGGGVAVKPAEAVKPEVKVVERVRCSRCKRLYEDGEVECPTCKEEDNKERQILQPYGLASGILMGSGYFLYTTINDKNKPHTHTMGTLVDKGHTHS